MNAAPRLKILAVLIACFAPLAAQAVSESLFPFEKSLAAPQVQQGQIGRFVLDDQIYGSTDDSYANLRIFDGNGAEVRYLIRRKVSRIEGSTPTPIQSEIASLRELGDNKIQLILKLGKHPADIWPRILEIVTPNANFEKQVTIEGSDDMAAWDVVVADVPIFDYTRYIDFRKMRVSMPESRRAYYRVTISNVSEDHESKFRQIVRNLQPAEAKTSESFTLVKDVLRIDQLRLMGLAVRTVDEKPVTASVAMTNALVAASTSNKTTVVIFGTRRQPLTALIVRTDESNFVRTARVECSNTDAAADPAGSTFSFLAEQRIHRMRLEGADIESLKISLPRACRALRYRVTIMNNDNPPLAAVRISAEGEVNEAVFIGSQAGLYRVLYGGSDIAVPSYDIGEMIAGASATGVPEWSLSEGAANRSYKPAKPSLPVGGKGIFIAALVVMTLVLLWILTRTARHI